MTLLCQLRGAGQDPPGSWTPDPIEAGEPKTEMEPENHPFEKENHLTKPSFLGYMLVFRGVPDGHHVCTR